MRKKVAKKTIRKTVFVGMSGGVDSSVTVAILKDKGYEVVGVFIRTWHPDFLPCNEEEERLDAMRVATHLDIPFLTFDFEDVYKKEVADYIIREYKAGRTPNGDVMCNKEVKFGAFLKKALAMGADYVATGHYAQISSPRLLSSHPSPLLNGEGKGVRQNLMKAVDPSKDQSYFLWTLSQKQLSKILFPVGHMKKTEVRKLAQKYKLPVAEKKDSQGICFLGEVDLKEFLKHYIKEKKGKVQNEKGETIGEHNGVVFSTLGERHGFTITKKTPNDKAYYVVGKNVKKNILYVSHNPTQPPLTVRGGAKGGGVIMLQPQNTNWILKPQDNKDYTAQVRYHGDFLSCRVVAGREVIFKEPVLVAPGQSIVVYDKDVVLGGGVVV